MIGLSPLFYDQHMNTSTVIDLCSGAGGPWLKLTENGWPQSVKLTDKYPNLELFEHLVTQPNKQIEYVTHAFASHLKSYSLQEMADLAYSVDSKNFVWEIGQITPPKAKVAISYLLGYPEYPN